MSNASLDLRPLTMGGILDRGFALYRRNFALFFGIALLVQSVTFVVMLPVLLTMPQETAGKDIDWPRAIVFVVGLCIAFPASIALFFAGLGTLTLAVSERFMGRQIRVMEAYRRMLAKMPNLLAVAGLAVLAVVAIGIFGGIAALAIGVVVRMAFPSSAVGAFLMIAVVLFAALAALLYAYLAFLLTAAVVMVEGIGPIAALKRSRQLMRVKTEKGFFRFRSNSSKAAVILVIGFVIDVIITLGVQGVGILLNMAFTPGEASAAASLTPWYLTVVTGLLTVLGNALVSPIYTVPIVLLYYDIRIRFEGFDLSILAESLAGPTGAEVAAPNA